MWQSQRFTLWDLPRLLTPKRTTSLHTISTNKLVYKERRDTSSLPASFLGVIKIRLVFSWRSISKGHDSIRTEGWEQMKRTQIPVWTNSSFSIRLGRVSWSSSTFCSDYRTHTSIKPNPYQSEMFWNGLVGAGEIGGLGIMFFTHIFLIHDLIALTRFYHLGHLNWTLVCIPISSVHLGRWKDSNHTQAWTQITVSRASKRDGLNRFQASSKMVWLQEENDSILNCANCRKSTTRHVFWVAGKNFFCRCKLLYWQSWAEPSSCRNAMCFGYFDHEIMR